MRPKLAARLPVCPQAFVMGNCILNNQSFYALGVRQDHSETHRSIGGRDAGRCAVGRR